MAQIEEIINDISNIEIRSDKELELEKIVDYLRNNNKNKELCEKEENLLFKEKCFLSKDTSKFLNSAYKDPKRKIIAVGTTTLRVLETSFINNNSLSMTLLFFISFNVLPIRCGLS